jgi:hypothetical protein
MMPMMTLERILDVRSRWLSAGPLRTPARSRTLSVSAGFRRSGGQQGTTRWCLESVQKAMLVLSFVVVGLGARSVRADAGGDRPWQRGVSAAQRSAAEQEFLLGNGRFERSDYAGAAEHYRQALTSWEHPSIQFNLAVCLINLDKPLEAFDMVQAALRFGRDGLRDHFDEANTYLRLLRDRIATLQVVIPPGAAVTLDGERLTSSGEVTRRLAPGRHSLVARKTGFEIWSKDLVLPPGETTREIISLRVPHTRTVRRWSPRTPWLVLGLGAGTLGVGAAGLVVGNANVRSVTAEVSRQCPAPAGCPTGLPKGLAGDRDRARLEQRLGVSLLAAGAGIAVTGVVLMVLNQPREVLDAGVSFQVSSEHVAVGWTHAF